MWDIQKIFIEAHSKTAHWLTTNNGIFSFFPFYFYQRLSIHNHFSIHEKFSVQEIWYCVFNSQISDWYCNLLIRLWFIKCSFVSSINCRSCRLLNLKLNNCALSTNNIGSIDLCLSLLNVLFKQITICIGIVYRFF